MCHLCNTSIANITGFSRVVKTLSYKIWGSSEESLWVWEFISQQLHVYFSLFLIWGFMGYNGTSWGNLPIIYSYRAISLYPYSCTAAQRFIWWIYDFARALYLYCMSVCIALWCLACYYRVSLSCLVVSFYNVHINVYTFFHLKRSPLVYLVYHSCYPITSSYCL